ncbi:DNA-3-methyladenine glycosylase family protein [Cellulomonas soli]
MFRFLAARAVQGVETADLTQRDELRYARTVALPGGPGAVRLVATRESGPAWVLRAHLELGSQDDAAQAVALVRRILDLDADPVTIDAALAADPALAPLVARSPGIRVPGAADPHELVVRAMVGQQISVAAARTHLGRLTQHAGPRVTTGIAGLERLFPTPAQIVAAVPEPTPGRPLDRDRPLRLPGAATHALLATCRALRDGDLPVHTDGDPAELRARLVARPRIGPWTAAYVAMRVLGDPDAWLDRDVALLAGARTLGIIDPELPPTVSHRLLADRATAWAPWRSYAVMHLWQVAAGPLPPRS